MLKLNNQQCEEIATSQYELFRPYLTNVQLASSSSANRQGAKDKLQRMSNQDFVNMSIDIYDELRRRKVNSPDVPFLPVNPALPANKNGAVYLINIAPKTSNVGINKIQFIMFRCNKRNRI